MENEHPIIHELREEWLEAAVTLMRPEFEAVGAVLPEKIRVACGFPSHGGLATKRKVLGECWHAEGTADKICQIYINPTEDMPDRVFSILRHELMHTVTKKGHGSDFKALGLKLGMEGKPKEMMANEEVTAFFKEHQLPKLGWYNQVRLEPTEKQKKQSTRMKKVWCDGVTKDDAGRMHLEGAHDEYVVRMAQKQIDRGLPTCGVCEREMEVDE